MQRYGEESWVRVWDGKFFGKTQRNALLSTNVLEVV